MFLIVGCQETQQWGDAAGPDLATILRLHMQEGLRDPRGVCQGNGCFLTCRDRLQLPSFCVRLHYWLQLQELRPPGISTF